MTPEGLWGLLLEEPRPVPMTAWGTMAFPHKWFTEIGGYDLEYRGWGYDDADLKLRAIWSIGAVEVGSVLILHQWHPREQTSEAAQQQSARNCAYYESTKALRQVVRNGGRLLPAATNGTPSCSLSRLQDPPQTPIT
jgi:predicted glycosyltransferase involved in capsule biosynthesis